jgi:transglutaminase-like putative cysteine protease
MGRTALLYPLPALLILFSWLGLEDPRESGRAVVAALLALVPALVRHWWARLTAAIVMAVLVLPGALGLSPVHTDGYTRLVGRFWNGFLAFYDVNVPFGPSAHPRMHGLVVIAVFGFCLALGLAIAAQRPVAASVVVAAGAAWPATLDPARNDLRLGGFVLAAVLVLFAGLRPPGRSVPQPALLAGVVVVVGALAATSSAAVAKDAFLGWQTWNIQGKQDQRVSVSYVWDGQYGGIQFPKKVTTVLRIAAPDRPLYWRATTLDLFDGERWRESVELDAPVASRGGLMELAPGPSYPRAAARPRQWIKQDVEVEALEDTHLIGASVPVAFRTQRDDVSYGVGGIASLQHPTRRGERYDVWSYVPDPSPRLLQAAPLRYPGDVLDHDLAVADEPMPRFGTPDRTARMDALFARDSADQAIAIYRPLYDLARRVAGTARSPYAAAVALEVWLRTAGGFTYNEHPPRPPAGVPPLVDFVTRTKAGYCQHFAGAMALMLRFLGIPARVAAGFTSGTYDSQSGVWTVTDHDAHTWVEVWFDGFGWLPFDPTPGRGALGGAYTASSPVFDASGAPTGLAASLGIAEQALRDRIARGREAARGVEVGSRGGGGAGGATDGLRNHAPNLLLLLLLVAVAGAALVGVAKVVVRRARYATRDPRRIASACRQELVDFLRDQRVETSPGATLAELNDALERRMAVSGNRFVAAAAAARFGAPAQAAGEARLARRELRGLLRAIRGRLTTTERARGLLSLRSLGFR